MARCSLATAVDGQIWLALVTPKNAAFTPASVRTALAALAASGTALSIGLAPVADIAGYEAFDQATQLPTRTLNWAVVTQDATGAVRQVPLEVQADTSNGGRTTGVALLRLPSNATLLAPPTPLNGGDPMFAGTVGMPPELAGRCDLRPGGDVADHELRRCARSDARLSRGQRGVHRRARDREQ